MVLSSPQIVSFHRFFTSIFVLLIVSYQLTFRFTTDADCLAYLDGRQFRVEKVDFVEEYFG